MQSVSQIQVKVDAHATTKIFPDSIILFAAIQDLPDKFRMVMFKITISLSGGW